MRLLPKVSVGTWRIWRRRNNSLFNGEFGEASSEVAEIFAFAKSITLANSRRNQQNDPTMSFTSWQLPPSDWCKLNTDGSRHLITELWAIADGLDIAWKRGGKQLLVESDCLIAVNMRNGQTEETEGSLARIVRELLARDWHVKVMFTPRTANMATESIATLGRNVPLGLRIYDVPPEMIKMEILQDNVDYDDYYVNLIKVNY
ncbi:Non-LTR retroelement reverse transcriptase-like [Gossypium australe]|uniref:Non-LTR retroelement reverse transcriptase-like n=1 Tax=Gossypium australe TaxID=47621 RepID=A0A5B6VUV7_9ROSI|nr:Non-LTR retroelement reverse transcriptase-like [Gossypium australe]